MTSNVSLLFLNVNTLSHRLDELSTLLVNAGLPLPPSFPRLFAFVETGRGQCKPLPSYAWISLDGPDSNGHGGCALYYHDSFAVTLLPASSTFDPEPTKPHHTRSTSILWCRVRPPGPSNSTFLLGIIYVPPQNNQDGNYSMRQVTASITAVTSDRGNRGLPLLLVGDFNARHTDWGDDNGGHNINSGSRHLASYIDNRSLHILNSHHIPGIATHSNPQHSSIIDLAITSDPALVLHMDMGWKHRFSSDHHPLTLTLRHTLAADSPPPPDSTRLHWRHNEHADVWQAALPSAMRTVFIPLLPRFLVLRQPLPHGVTPQHIIDRLCHRFEHAFLTVCQEEVGTKIVTAAPHANRWWSQAAVLPAYRAVVQARRQHAHRRTPTSLAAYKLQQQVWRVTVKQAKKQSWTALCDKVNQADAKQRWTAVARSQPSSFSPLASIPDGQGKLPSDLLGSLNNLCAAFVSEAIPPPPPVTTTIHQYRNLKQWTHPTQSTLPPHASDSWTFTTNAVAAQCRYQNIHSAPGADNILPAFLRHAGRLVHAILSLIFTFSWQHAVLPQSWTEANVMALYKGAADAARGKPAGSRASASSYRPISMTSIIIRTFEHLVHKRLITELESRDFFSPLQFGFRVGHTTADAINYLLSTVRRVCRRDSHYTDGQGTARRHKMPCPVVFLDIKKAFDRVWHPMLLSYLHDASITGRAWRWIRAFLSRRRIRTVQLTTCSSWHTIQYGVPQGAVLSPLLFLIFINPVLLRIIQECPLVSPLAFADDGTLAPCIIERNPAIIAAHNHRRSLLHLPAAVVVERKFDLQHYLNQLQNALTILDQWCEESRVRFGQDKTKMVVFCGAQGGVDMSRFTSFSLCGFNIGLTSHYTYLGVVLHNKLSWELHLGKALSTARRISSHITRLTLAATTAHYPSVRTLVLCLLLPSFAYGIAFWGRDMSDHNLRRLNSALTQPLRRCLCLPRTTHQTGVLVEANCPSIGAWLQRELLLLYSRFHGLSPQHPSKIMHTLDTTQRLPPAHAAHHILEEGKYIYTSRYVQLILLPRLGRHLQPFIQHHSPPNHPMRTVLAAAPALRPDGSNPFAFLSCLTATGTGRRTQLQQHLNPPGHLQEVEQWTDSALPSLTPIRIRSLPMWSTHYEWRHPLDAEHKTDAPLLHCKQYPRPTHFLGLEPHPISQLRTRFRARRNFTGEHHRQLENKAASAACTHSVCQSQQPQPDDTVEHILLNCPRHAIIRNTLLAAFRAATTPHAVLTLSFILGEAVDTMILTKANTAHYSLLLNLSATFLRDVDRERQAAHLVAFKPP
jgi:hypothetical protein